MNRFFALFRRSAPKEPIYRKFQICVFYESEGTAQGIPRPLSIHKEEVEFSYVPGKQTPTHPEMEAYREAERTATGGFMHKLADGTRAFYPVGRIYKVTMKEITDE